MEKEEKVIKNLTISKPDFINTDYKKYLEWKKQKEENENK